MKKTIYPLIIFSLTLFSFKLQAQNVNILIGTRDSIVSQVLNETRTFIVHTPDGYNESKKLYPVLFRLDGDQYLLLETIGITNRLCYDDEFIPEMIVIAIENTNRARDMWPVNNAYYPEPEKAGAKDFLSFLEKELLPYIDKEYRTNKERILCGQSLSAVFTIYAFLSKPDIFNSYIAISGAFPGCENFFDDLINTSFQTPKQFKNKNFYISNGLKDPLDPDGSMNQHIVNFSKKVNEKLGNTVEYNYQLYDNEGHVPYHSLYDGLRLIFRSYSD